MSRDSVLTFDMRFMKVRCTARIFQALLCIFGDVVPSLGERLQTVISTLECGLSS